MRSKIRKCGVTPLELLYLLNKAGGKVTLWRLKEVDELSSSWAIPETRSSGQGSLSQDTQDMKPR